MSTHLFGGEILEPSYSEKELLILESAIQVFAEKGFSAATTNEIAKSAGISEGTIFRYFKTKKDIMRSLVKRSIEIIAPKMVVKSLEEFIKKNNNLDEIELLKKIIHNRIGLINKNFSIFKIIISESFINKEIRDIWIEKVIKTSLPHITGIVDRGIEKGIIKDINSNIVIRSMFGMIMAYFLHKNLASEIIPIQEDWIEINSIIDVFFDGICTKGEVK